MYVCVCLCVCRIYWTYSQHKQYYCRVDDEVAWPPLHPTSSTQKTALPARLQNIAANHCHAVTWGSSCDQISITLSCGCRDVCSSSCPNDKVRKFHSLLIFLGQLYNSQEKEGEIIPWKYKKMKEIYLENNDRTSGRERTLQWTDKVSLHHTKTWSGHEHMTTSLVTQPHYTTLSNDMVSMPPANTKIKDNISADHHMLVWEGHMVMYY